MKDYDGGRLLVSSEGIDRSKMPVFNIGKLYKYLEEQEKKGRKPEDITLEELEPFIRKQER